MNEVVQKFKSVFAENLRFGNVVALDNCLRCGSCGDACSWYHTTEDIERHPLHKKDLLRRVYHQQSTREGRFLQRLGFEKSPSDDEIIAAMDSFWKCTTCGRCSMACPMGLDNRSLFHVARRAYNECGLMQNNAALASVDKNTAQTGHSFGLCAEQVFVRLGFFLAHNQVEIPLDAPGAEYLFACPAVGSARIPDLGIQIPMLLNACGVSFTISSRIIDTATDVIHITDRHDIARAMLLNVEAEAERLGVKTLLISECGCDARTFYMESTKILGRPLRIPVQHLDSLLLDCIQSNTLPVTPALDPITFHDPCKLVRLAGMGDMERKLLERVATHVTEMTPHGAHNYCCNGGSGALRIPELQDLRRHVSILKAEQIRKTGAERVITPCTVCKLTLQDICDHYHLPVKSQLMFELVFEAVERNLGKGHERIQRSTLFKNSSAEFADTHGMQAFLQRAAEAGTLQCYAQALREDPIVKRYALTHPGAMEFLDTWLNQWEEVTV